MNVYDCANELAKAMRESQEYKKLKEAKAALEQDPKGKEMAEEFLKLSQEIELAKYQGQEVKTVKLETVFKNEPTTTEFTKSDITTGVELSLIHI